ncbi:MAG: lasso peptide biosynthesis B2 protein [Anaerolineales bacterium]|nr:lasso peptide biosynthesis B2 protein [Anaerolineales bacterium]MCB8950846.1 lasso peptide biosynthesis B2 protein [Ardenticatenales bacterium]
MERVIPVGDEVSWRMLPALIIAWLGLIWVAGWLRWRGLARTWDRLARMPAFPATPVEPHHLARLVHIAAHYLPFRSTCLERSLLLWTWLRRRGYAAELRLGVCRHSSHLQAHAWVEYAGNILNTDPAHAAQYASFDLTDPAALPGRLWS